jgi:hypothetical protein
MAELLRLAERAAEQDRGDRERQTCDRPTTDRWPSISRPKVDR